MAVIAISCAYDKDADKATLHMGYMRCIYEAGGTPVMVYMDKNGYRLPKVDGLVLSGGGDIAPAFFSKKPTEHFVNVQLERDLFEFSLIKQCMHLPILGICRGMQVLNTAYAGNLIDHIHGHDLGMDGRHCVSADRSSRLFTVFGSDCLPVNSMHHQSVDKPGVGMRVSARSKDGITEAIEHTQKPHFGVQWHPEKLNDQASKNLFNFFVNLCK